jgi:hypothetical protein
MKPVACCVTEADLGAIDVAEYGIAHLVDDSGREPRFLFNVYPSQSAPAGQPQRRLLVHVGDAYNLTTVRRVLDALRVEPSAVPF